MRRGASRLTEPILQASLKTQAREPALAGRRRSHWLPQAGRSLEDAGQGKNLSLPHHQGVVTRARTVAGLDSTVLICSGVVAVGASLIGRTSTVTLAAAE